MKRRSPSLGLCLLVALSPTLLLAKCGGEPSAAPEADAGWTLSSDVAPDGATGDVAEAPLKGTLRGACGAGDLAGFFEVVYGKYTSYFSGEIGALPAPVSTPQELLATGPCTLRARVPLLCTSPCASGQICGLGGLCVDSPGSLGVGTVTLSGLLEAVELEPTEGTGYYLSSSLPHPPFEVGAALRLDAEGAGDGELILYGIGVDKLETSQSECSLVAGEPLSVTWTPGAVPEAEIEVLLSIDQDNSEALEIVCTSEDTGSLEIAGDLIEGLLASEISGFPAVTITRRTLDSDVLDRGCVELRVSSSALIAVSIP
jgi:hypothetical protein